MLEARPALAKHLAAILAHAPVLAEQLGRRPQLLDGLIDASAFAPAPPVEELIAGFARADRAGEDYQMILDRVRRRVNERRFALGVQLVAAYTDPLEVTEGYSRTRAASRCGRRDGQEFERRMERARVEWLILGLAGSAASADPSSTAI